MELKKSINVRLIQQSNGTRVFIENEELTLKELTPHYKHGDGFAWGYGGRGPHDLAWGICYQLYGQLWAPMIYWEFLQIYVKNWSNKIADQTIYISLEEINTIIRNKKLIDVQWDVKLCEFDPIIRELVVNGKIKTDSFIIKDILEDERNMGTWEISHAEMCKLLKEKYGNEGYLVNNVPTSINTRKIN